MWGDNYSTEQINSELSRLIIYRATLLNFRFREQLLLINSVCNKFGYIRNLKLMLCVSFILFYCF